jgi:DNA-binding CsgD family transcriptional regulator
MFPGSSMQDDKSKDQDASPITRLGDVAAMLRVMRPLITGIAPDDVDGRRRMLADLCKFIGVKLGTVPPESLGFPVAPVATAMLISTTITQPEPTPEQLLAKDLAPRLQQTLGHLLEGDSEKQVARKLGISPHTVHVYIKTLYRKFNVTTRAELMSRHVKK